ncbi:hypothetical protein W02_36100 [Nitrospira sp. KM1]|uniref:hypothetical protein n=1 Tax=Nitrospira sp. KM1 TaxID=1936990 RepID=UPI0013A75CA0|nr:hypothetical protein [Nitrospira sp. KM1]BCA56470.1 hypothetical protein W02_36100 [Nitrospira sp. KM1]
MKELSGHSLTHCLLASTGALALLCGCEFLVPEKQRVPIGYSRDGNGRPCATYEIKKDAVYETLCDYERVQPDVVRNPLSKQQPTK